MTNPIMWNLDALSDVIPPVDGTTPDGLDAMFAAHNAAIKAGVKAIDRVHASTDDLALKREVEYLVVGITAEPFGQRNPGQSKLYAPVVARWTAIHKSTMANALKRQRARLTAVLVGLGVLALTVADVLPGEGEGEGEGEPTNALLQAAVNFADALDKESSPSELAAALAVVETAIVRAHGIAKQAAKLAA